jgi:hypothetical protein
MKKRIVALAVLCAPIAHLPALADQVFGGKDAAHIDWAASNCGVASTDKAHALVDKAKSKNEKEFSRIWTSESYRLLETPGSSPKAATLCSQIKEWYGPVGTRFSDLIKWTQDRPEGAKAQSATGRSEGRKGKRRSGQ